MKIASKDDNIKNGLRAHLSFWRMIFQMFLTILFCTRTMLIATQYMNFLTLKI
jgi:hypothetical protein